MSQPPKAPPGLDVEGPFCQRRDDHANVFITSSWSSSITYKTKATARWALTFVVRIFVNDARPIAVWTSFHAI
jgi:hypothetical protein